MKKYLMLLCIAALAGCNQENISEEEKHLDSYLKETHQIDVKKYPQLFVIVISGNCGSCTEKTINFIKQIDKKDKFTDYKRIIIIPDNNAYVVDSFKNAGSQFIADKGYMLEKYGINFPRNLFMEFKDKQLVYKDWLYLDNVDSIAKKYGLSLPAE